MILVGAVLTFNALTTLGNVTLRNVVLCFFENNLDLEQLVILEGSEC